MARTFNVPEDDRFQIITSHDAVSGIAGPEAFLGVDHTSDPVFVQITCADGRTEKGALFDDSGSRVAGYRHPAGRRDHQSRRDQARELVIRQWRCAIRELGYARAPAARAR